MEKEQVPQNYFQKLLESCQTTGMDESTCAFASYDTCGPESPIRNCTPGNALFAGVIMTFLGIPVGSSVDESVRLRDEIRRELMCPEVYPGNTGDLMRISIKMNLKLFFSRLKGSSREEKLKNMWIGKMFLMDILDGKVGTDVFRDPALELLKRQWTNCGCSLSETHGWDAVRFPIVFHLQWDNNLTKSGKPRMLFHTSYDPWRMATGIAMALCGPTPPVQVRETPYKDPLNPHQSPRKYVIDWDLFVEENLGKAAPMDVLTEDYLFNMFTRSLAVIHAYMRKAGVLPGGRKLCMSIKSRTRRAKNKSGRMDTKCSYHATVHIMEPGKCLEVWLRHV